MSERRPTAGFSERLGKALERGPNPKSMRGLARALQNHETYQNLRGISDGGVRHYVNGKVRNPRTELLRAMADVLGVRGDWLAFGQGAMTEAEEAVGSTLEHPLDQWRGKVADALLEGFFGESSDALVDRLGERALRILVRYWSLARPSRITGREFDYLGQREEEDLTVARDIGAAAAAPLRAFGTDPATISAPDLDTYFSMTEPSFMFAFRLETEARR